MKQVIYLGIKPVYVNVYQANVFQINNQRWNNNKYRCECRELIDKGDVLIDLFGTLVYVNVNVISHVIVQDIQIA